MGGASLDQVGKGRQLPFAQGNEMGDEFGVAALDLAGLLAVEGTLESEGGVDHRTLAGRDAIAQAFQRRGVALHQIEGGQDQGGVVGGLGRGFTGEPRSGLGVTTEDGEAVVLEGADGGPAPVAAEGEDEGDDEADCGGTEHAEAEHPFPGQAVHGRPFTRPRRVSTWRGPSLMLSS